MERYVASPAAFDPRRLILPDQQPSDFAPEIVAAHACLADGEEVRQSATLTAAMPGSEASEIGSETEEADRPSGEESEEEDD